MQSYASLGTYNRLTRSSLQDLIEPYRYSDQDILDGLNFVLFEIQRLRPDMFLDLKYQRRMNNNTDDGAPSVYLSTMNQNIKVPIPAKYMNTLVWYISGYLQLYDVTDTQDQRAQAFMMKFNQHMLTLSAA